MKGRTLPLFTELPRETVRKGYEQCSARGFGWYTEGEMDLEAPLCRPAGLRYKCVRGFSDSLYRKPRQQAIAPVQTVGDPSQRREEAARKEAKPGHLVNRYRALSSD